MSNLDKERSLVKLALEDISIHLPWTSILRNL